MSTNEVASRATPSAVRTARRARPSRRLGEGCAASVAAREARERRQALAEIATLMRRNPFLDVEL
jgi:hypothetical protein